MRQTIALALLALVPAVAGPSQSAVARAPLTCEDQVAPSDSGSGVFGRVAPGPGGRLAWTDGRRGELLLRSADGRVRTIGRSGAGPGEFQRIGLVGWIGDTLWVSDPNASRVQFFSDTGRYLRGQVAAARSSWGARPDGRLVGVAGRLIASTSLPVAVLSLSAGARTADTVIAFPWVEGERVLVPAAGREVPNPHPFLANTQVAASADHGRFCGAIPLDAESVRLHCVDDRGKTLLDRRLTLPPRPLSDSLYEAVIRLFSQSPPRTPAMMRARISRPRLLPPVNGLRVDDDGTIWVARTHDMEGQSLWLRLRPDGTMRDEVALPARQRVVATQSDSVWVAVADEDGLETLRRCRVGR